MPAPAAAAAAQEARPPPDLVSGNAAVGAPGGPAGGAELRLPLEAPVSIDRHRLMTSLETRLVSAKRQLDELPANADLDQQYNLVRLISALCQAVCEARRL